MWLAEKGSEGSIWITIAPFILMFAIFYFLLIRPQQKKQKQRGSMLNALKKGDKVVTAGGLHGTIAEITDDTIVLKVNDVTKLTFERSSINNVTARSTEKESGSKE
ncbi:preprotein translocase subunit YajC [Cohnella soli]|uniref:Preprotein translocase subunit YajC n=1 Tax=Cohnella soli TaxID=425005 RepID=A0ABW0HSP8_9BACL